MNIYELNKLLINLPKYSPSQEELQEIEMSIDYPRDNQEKIIYEDYAIDEFYSEESERLDEDELRAVEGGIRSYGIDVLAFYKSFRLLNQRPCVGKW